MHCIQWTRKEVASIFSTVQSPSRIFSLGWMPLIPDWLSKTQSVLRTSSTGRTCQLLSVPPHHQGSLFLQWVGCSDLLSHLSCAPQNTHTTHTTRLSFYCRVCSSLIHLPLPPPWIDRRSGGFPLISCFFLTHRNGCRRLCRLTISPVLGKNRTF